ncbi:hypothetical protein MATL_G00199030 [Megalops atlanticus]|uniref:Uncharacterized protein n=1 Tax=Megalops atlanticus TaxID=7932 RepID=A0A9D3SYU4_MEGAT|nr:hypothetical protein MATL_G00199030 [Megalops atlanticus]
MAASVSPRSLRSGLERTPSRTFQHVQTLLTFHQNARCCRPVSDGGMRSWSSDVSGRGTSCLVGQRRDVPSPRLPVGRAGGDSVWELLESERRRESLELSLTKARRALQSQHCRLLQQHGAWAHPRKMFPLKLREIKGTDCSGISAAGFTALQYGDLYQRIGKLQSELEVLRWKVNQGACPGGSCWHIHSPKLDMTPPVKQEDQGTTAQLIALAMDNSQLQRERGDLERLAQDVLACLGLLEQGREALEAQVSGLRAELFQTRCREQELRQNSLASQAELTGCRQLSDSIQQEVSALRRRLASSEERVALMESERSVLAARLQALESEREQLLSQKALLVQKLWHSGTPPGQDAGAGPRPPAGPGRALDMHAGGSGRESAREEKEDREEGPKEMSAQLEHLQLQCSQDPLGGATTVSAQPLPVTQGEAGDEPKLKHMWMGESVRPVEYHSGAQGADRGFPQEQSGWRSQVGQEKGPREDRCHDLWHDDPHSANQIAALAIELQQLRKANSVASGLPDCAGGMQARDWLDRVTLVKECVGEMERNEASAHARATPQGPSPPSPPEMPVASGLQVATFLLPPRTQRSQRALIPLAKARCLPMSEVC